MTDLLAEAFKQASLLPEAVQDQLAQELLDELAADRKWDETLERTQDALIRMADKADQESLEGKTKAMGFDEL